MFTHEHKQDAYLLADVLSAFDIFGLGLLSLLSPLLLSFNDGVPRPRPAPLEPAPDAITWNPTTTLTHHNSA